MTGETLLQQICNRENLMSAWTQVARKKSAPGVDNETVGDFSYHLEARLHALKRSMRRAYYRPRPLRGVHIPKRRGGWREAGVPCVRDRVAQRAWLNIVAPILDARFADSSHAYRPARSIHTAIAQLERRRDRGCRFVLESDVENCFPSIDRSWMLQTLNNHICEKPVLMLARHWMEAGVVWSVDGERELPVTGIAQGDLISPLLCNVFLDRFDADLLKAGFVPVRYADDFVVPVKKEAGAHGAFQEARRALAKLGLELNLSKTRISHFSQGFEFVGSLFVDNMVLPLHRQEFRNHKGKECVRFSSGYEETPIAIPSDPRPKVLSPVGMDAISTSLRFSSVRASTGSTGQELQKAMRQRQRKRRQTLKKDAEKPLDTTFLT